MRSLFALIIAVNTILPAFAHAQAALYKVVGRGIQNPETGDSIALVCVGDPTTEGPACDRIQHYFFSGKTFEATPMGNVYTLNFENGEKAGKVIKSKLRQISKDYRRFHHNDPKVKKRRLYIGIGMALFAVLLPYTHILYHASNELALGVIFGITFAGMHVSDRGGRSLTGSEGTSVPFVTQTFADDRGWNWASSPQTIKAKKFDFYLKFLKSMKSADSDSALLDVEDARNFPELEQQT